MSEPHTSGRPRGRAKKHEAEQADPLTGSEPSDSGHDAMIELDTGPGQPPTPHETPNLEPDLDAESDVDDEAEFEDDFDEDAEFDDDFEEEAEFEPEHGPGRGPKLAPGPHHGPGHHPRPPHEHGPGPKKAAPGKKAPGKKVPGKKAPGPKKHPGHHPGPGPEHGAGHHPGPPHEHDPGHGPDGPEGEPDFSFGPGAGFGSGPVPDFGSGFGFGPGGNRGRQRGFDRARRGRRGDVRAAILTLLAERPMHGYEMIQEIAERTQDLWRPSPGSVYPTLQLLDDEGLIGGSEIHGSKRLFELTDEGRAAAEKIKSPPWEHITAGADQGHVDLRAALGQLVGAVTQAANVAAAAQQQRIVAILKKARREIYTLLAEED
jgi:DNA-binding PadR family transcriptional regulator